MDASDNAQFQKENNEIKYAQRSERGFRQQICYSALVDSGFRSVRAIFESSRAVRVCGRNNWLKFS